MQIALAAVFIGNGLASDALAQETLHNEDTKFNMVTVDEGSQPAKFMTTFAKIVSNNLKTVEISVFSGGTDTLDTMSLSRSMLDMSLISPVTHDLMTTGSEMFRDETVAAELSAAVQLLMWFPRGRFHFAVRADSPITALDDIKGATVFLGPHQQSAEFHDAKNWVKATTGLVAEKDFEAIIGPWDSGAEALVTGDVDVFVSACLDPCARLEVLSSIADLRFIGPADTNGTAGDQFFQAGRGKAAKKTKMQGGKKSGRTVDTFQTIAGIAVYDATDEQTVYNVVKAYWENLDETLSDQRWADTMNITYAATKRGLIALHPGAARYYRDVGAID